MEGRDPGRTFRKTQELRKIGSKRGNSATRMREGDVRVRNEQGTNAFVQVALDSINISIRMDFASLKEKFLEDLRSDSKGRDQEEICHELWIRLSRDGSSLLIKHYQSLFDIAFCNPEILTEGDDPADWAYSFLHPHIVEILEFARETIIPKIVCFSPDEDEVTDSYLSSEFYAELNNAVAPHVNGKVQLAARGWRPRSRASTQINRDDGNTIAQFTSPAVACTSSAQLRFTLRDLEDAPDNMSRKDIVSYLHPLLKQAIKDARTYIDMKQNSSGIKPSIQELSALYPVLRHAIPSELEYISTRSKTAHLCSILIMVGRTLLPRDTITRYLYPMKKQHPR
jgi:hypothetical protein